MIRFVQSNSVHSLKGVQGMLVQQALTNSRIRSQQQIMVLKI